MKTSDGVEEDPQDLANAPIEETTSNHINEKRSIQPPVEKKDR